jgi:hypothetical protein
MRCRVLGIGGLAVGVCLAGASFAIAVATTAATTAATSPSPVLHSIDNGSEAWFVVQNPDGSKSDVFLKKGDTIPWNNAKVLDIVGRRVRISHPATMPGGPEWIELRIGDNVEGQSTLPPKTKPAPPPPNPAFVALSTEVLFAKCLTATGTGYAEAKAVMVSRPKEAAALAQKMLDNKDTPWQNRVLAQAMAEEIADSKAYAAAHMEIIRVAHIAGATPGHGGDAGAIAAALKTNSAELYKLLARYPGLSGEIILKATAESNFALVGEWRLQGAIQDWQRKVAEGLDEDQVPLEESLRVYWMKPRRSEEPAEMLRYVCSLAALACAYAPNADTQSLLKSLDSKEYAGVLAECERFLQEAASKPGAATAAASATRGAE